MYKLNEQQIEDVMSEIIKMKSPGNLPNCKTVFTENGNTTIATLVYHDDKGNVIVKHGFANRRKGDKCNIVVGQLLSLMRTKDVQK